MSGNSPQHTEQLQKINEKIIAAGEVLPTVKLRDGSKVQTGTVATMLFNIKLYDAGERDKVQDELRLSVPTLFKVGLFDLFSPQEWAAGSSPGRKFVGEAAMEWQKQQASHT